WSSDGRQVQRSQLSDLETLWAFTPGASMLASASDDLVLWETSSGSQYASIQQLSWVTAIAFRPDGAVIATGHDDGRVRLWNVESQKMEAEFHGHKQPLSALSFNPSGKLLASASEDRLIQIVDVAGSKCIQTLKGHTDRIPALAWHADGQMLAS